MKVEMAYGQVMVMESTVSRMTIPVTITRFVGHRVRLAGAWAMPLDGSSASAPKNPVYDLEVGPRVAFEDLTGGWTSCGLLLEWVGNGPQPAESECAVWLVHPTTGECCPAKWFGS